jgi:hypothetical protein
MPLYTRKKVAELTKLFEICGFHCGAGEPMFWYMMLLYRLNNLISQRSVTVNDVAVN